MISMLAYILLPEAVGVLSASIGLPMTLFVIIHSFILRPSGIGWTPDFDYDVYYPLVAFMFSVVGWLFGWGTGLRDAFWCYIIGDRWYHRMFRMFKAALVVIVMAVAIVPFEMIDPSDWVGGFVALVIDMIAIWVVFFLFFRYWGPGACGPSMFYEPAYQFGDQNLALQTAVYMTIVHFVCIVLFWILYYGGWLWQFWIALILFGVFFIVGILVTILVAWLNHRLFGAGGSCPMKPKPIQSTQ